MSELSTTSLHARIAAADYAEILAYVADNAWTRAGLNKLHSAVIAWAERAVATHSAGSCRDLADLLRRLRVVRGEAELDAVRSSTSDEWRGIEQVLDEHIAKAEGNEEHRKSVLGRRHVQSVLALLRNAPEGKIPQKRLLEQLRSSGDSSNLGAPQLSQVLSMMESAQLIARDRAYDASASDGRIKWVWLLEDVAAAPKIAGNETARHGVTRLPGWNSEIAA